MPTDATAPPPPYDPAAYPAAVRLLAGMTAEELQRLKLYDVPAAWGRLPRAEVRMAPEASDATAR